MVLPKHLFMLQDTPCNETVIGILQCAQFKQIHPLCLLTKQDFWGLPCTSHRWGYTPVCGSKRIFHPCRTHRRILAGRFGFPFLGIRDESFDGCVENLVAMKIKIPGSTEGAKLSSTIFKPLGLGELSLDSSQEQGLQKHLKVLCGISHPHLCKAGSVALPPWKPRCIQESLEGWYVLPRISLGQPWSTFISIMDSLLTSLRVWAWITFLPAKFD